MPLPIDLAGDWQRLHADLLREVQYREYDPAADDGTADPHGDAEACVGVRGPVTRSVRDGAPVSLATWTITGIAETPVLQSLIVDGTDNWVVLDATPDPAAGTVHSVSCYKTR
jgi:hypothetical protein